MQHFYNFFTSVFSVSSVAKKDFFGSGLSGLSEVKIKINQIKNRRKKWQIKPMCMSKTI
jgi:hypothetical protein